MHMCTSLCLDDKSVVQLFRLAQYCVNPVFFMLLPSLNRMISPKVGSFSAFPTSVNCGFVGVSFYQAGFLWICQHTMCAYLCTYNILASCIYYIFVFIWSGDKVGLMDFWSKVCCCSWKAAASWCHVNAILCQRLFPLKEYFSSSFLTEIMPSGFVFETTYHILFP